ncbi:MAG: ubiquitin-like small modifier protein 1 [Methanobacteriota archaeon]
MSITVKFFANFREAAGVEKTEVDGVKDISSLLDVLVAKFGAKLKEQLFEGKKLRETVNILINGRGVNLEKGLDAKLRDGDVLAVFPPVSGGCCSVW